MGAASLQTRFAHALLAPDAPAPRDIEAGGANAERRFSVYRNNVVIALIDALAAIFPTVRDIVGADSFAALARAYIAEYLPASPVLADYGDEFPDFVARVASANDLAHLPDVARLDRMWLDAYHAANAPALGPAAFAALPSDALGILRIGLHPSVGLLSSRHAVVSIWRARHGQCDPAGVDPDAPEDALVVRPALDVEIVRLAPGEAAFLESLRRGAPLGEATAHAMAAKAFDLAHALEIMIAHGVATTISDIEGGSQ